MKKINFTDVSEEILKQLDFGAFLTVKNKNQLNTMTIAWGSIGYLWNRDIFMKLPRTLVTSVVR